MKIIWMIAVALSLSTTCFAEALRISDSGYIGCKDKGDIIGLALIAQGPGAHEDVVKKFRAFAKKLEAAKKCRAFKKGERVELYTLGDKEYGADIHQIAFPPGSDHYKRAVE
ncbi:hypothetical protein [Syntrophorhabdus aromaticivorans]|uniref:hypothetical protein n=1 Tax=Syntrophorhabdus aromaticivorans TaxID=328301 RepID=UPI000423FDBD|nr:hypothetical protein [Syntrophorhabdus aromaticivorans]